MFLPAAEILFKKLELPPGKKSTDLKLIFDIPDDKIILSRWNLKAVYKNEIYFQIQSSNFSSDK